MLDGVFRSGKPVAGQGQPITLQREGRQEQRYLDYIYQPILDPDGSVSIDPD